MSSPPSDRDCHELDIKLREAVPKLNFDTFAVLARLLGVDEGEFSNFWDLLDKYKKKHGATLRKLCYVLILRDLYGVVEATFGTEIATTVHHDLQQSN